jgi:sulfotransferase family protein
MVDDSIRLAMWSGPRNISTAMMRSWGSRPDTIVCDEPLYAHYLLATADRRHPGYEETLASHETDVPKVVRWLTGPLPKGKRIFYQKHMAHHLLPDIDVGWIDSLANAFLIRNPREMLTSLLEFLPDPRLEDTGLPQQVALFERVRSRTKTTPPILDAADVLKNPRSALTTLCDAIGVPFLDDMLQWAPGPRDTDGAWARHWYAKVYETTTFAPYRAKGVNLPPRLAPLLAECDGLYRRLYEHRLH